MSNYSTSPTVLVVYDRPEEIRDLLEPRFPELRIGFATSAAEIIERLAELQPAVVFSMKHSGFPGPLHRPVVHHPGVQWVQVGGSGYEHLQPWDAERLTVTHCAGVLAPYLAETVTAAMLTLNGGFLHYRDEQRRTRWSPGGFAPLREQTLLVVGVGAVGGHVADNARALGMRVLGVRRESTPHPSVDEMHCFDRFLDVVGAADWVSLHLRETPATRFVVDARALAAMRRGASLINTARGGLVDEAALLAALESGHIRAAYLDVFETEPLPADSPLWRRNDVLITPHVADAVHDWPRRFTAFFADNLERWLGGDTLHNVVADT